MKVLVFGGTTEGRLLARELSALGAQVTVSVATALGAEELRGVPPLTVCVGRKDARQMREMLPGFAVCVDATHPYAAEASGNIRAACLAAGVPYRRLLRGASALPPDSVVVPDAPAAARWLAGTQGNILLATGAKELAAFAGLDAERLYPRVLPTHEGLAACEAAGVQWFEEATRGGTDGARLSYMGLPCPNLGTGGHNFHGPYECITAESMDKAVEIILNIIALYAA